MKKFTSVAWLCLLLFSSTVFAQTTLKAGPNVLQGNGSGNQSWGPDITLSALKINGEPGRLAYESQFTDNGFGVVGGRWLQIDYYQSYQGQTVNASEKFIITFASPATDVVLEVGQLDPNEGWKRAPGRECNESTGRQKVDESGKYTAYNQNGQVVGTGLLLPSKSIEGKLPNSAGGYRFNINAGNQAIKKIVLEATQWGGDEFGCPRYRNNYPSEPTNDSGNSENNSDFNVSGITYTLATNNSALATNDSEWRTEEDMLQRRGEHANAIVNGKLYVMGGIFKSNFGPTEVEVYNFNNKQWSVVSQLPVHKNHFTIGSSVYGNEIWVCGGKLNGSGTNSNSGSRSVHVYNTADNTWRKGPDLPEDHWAGPAVIIGDKLHVLSGGIGKTKSTDHHLVLDLKKEAAGWETLKAVPEPRVHAAGVAYGGKIWMIGGELSHNHNGDTKTVQVYDPANDTWDLNVPQLPEARSHLEWSTFVYENRIYSVSGVNSAKTPRGQETIYVYSDEAGKWNRTFDLPGKLVSPGAKIYQDRMYVFGGGVDDWFGGDMVSVYSREIENKNPAGEPTTENPSINQKAVIVSKVDADFILQVNNTANRTSAVVEACDDEGQVWTISDRGNGFHKIINDFANKALEAWQPTPANGDNVTIYKSNNNDWQQWELIAAGDGFFRIKGKYNQRFVTLSNGNAVMLSENSQNAQLWRLVAPGSVTCGASSENNPPVAVEDGDFSNDPDYTLTVGETLVIPFSRLLANDSDPDGDPLTIIAVDFIRNGNPVIVGNTVEFTGVDASPGALFGYTISDGRGGVASTTVSLNILDASLDPVVLEASGLQTNGGTDPLAWGSCAEIAAFSASGTPVAITLRRGRAGVQGNRSNTQLDYDPLTNTSEKLEIDFNQLVGQVSFTLGNLETNEWQGADETGTWALVDDGGNVLSQGIISPTSGTTQGSSVYTFSTSYSGGTPTKLVLEATAYDSGTGPNRTDNNSDYSLISVAYTPVGSACNQSFGVANATAEAPIIYPTAVQNTINIKIDENSQEQVLSVVVYNNSGIVVEEISAIAEDQKTFEIKNLKEGPYFVRVTTSKGQYSYKVMKE